MNKGLTDNEVKLKLTEFGYNELSISQPKTIFKIILEVIKEPMFILLVASCIIYFSLNQIKEGFIMLGSILLVSGISIFQEYRSRNAILSLKKISAPHVKVLRN